MHKLLFQILKIKKEVNHIDNNPLNNNVKNLEWCSHSENVLHSMKYGNRKTKYNKASILKDIIESKLSINDIAKKYKIPEYTVRTICYKNNIY